MIVNEDSLPFTPKAFQDYVSKYFRKVKLHGKIRYIAFRVFTVDCKRIKRKGVAPSHRHDLQEFKEGLPDDGNLDDWIRSNIDGRFFELYSGMWEDGFDKEIKPLP